MNGLKVAVCNLIQDCSQKPTLHFTTPISYCLIAFPISLPCPTLKCLGTDRSSHYQRNFSSCAHIFLVCSACDAFLRGPEEYVHHNRLLEPVPLLQVDGR